MLLQHAYWPHQYHRTTSFHPILRANITSYQKRLRTSHLSFLLTILCFLHSRPKQSINQSIYELIKKRYIHDFLSNASSDIVPSVHWTSWLKIIYSTGCPFIVISIIVFHQCISSVVIIDCRSEDSKKTNEKEQKSYVKLGRARVYQDESNADRIKTKNRRNYTRKLRLFDMKNGRRCAPLEAEKEVITSCVWDGNEVIRVYRKTSTCTIKIIIVV